MNGIVYLYRHYKGGLYYVLTEAVLETDGTRVVVYRGVDGSIWVRPALEFYGFVDDEYKTARFVRLGFVDTNIGRLS